MHLLDPAGKPFHVSHLMPMVGCNGCGPDSAEALFALIRERHAVARKTFEVQHISFAGVYDLLVYPGGYVALLPTNLQMLTIPSENVASGGDAKKLADPVANLEVVRMNQAMNDELGADFDVAPKRKPE